MEVNLIQNGNDYDLELVVESDGELGFRLTITAEQFEQLRTAGLGLGVWDEVRECWMF